MTAITQHGRDVMICRSLVPALDALNACSDAAAQYEYALVMIGTLQTLFLPQLTDLDALVESCRHLPAPPEAVHV